jgi:hypothetical protein
MKTSAEDIMARDFEQFLAEDVGAVGDLDFKALGAVPGGRGAVWGELWRQVAETAAGFNLLDYLVFTSPAAALAVFIFVGKPLMERMLLAYLQGL